MLPPIIAPPGRSSVQVTQARSRMSGLRFMRRHSASSCGRHERQPARRRRAPTTGSKATDKDFSSENAIKFWLRVCDKQRGRIRRVCPFFSFFFTPVVIVVCPAPGSTDRYLCQEHHGQSFCLLQKGEQRREGIPVHGVSMGDS